MVVAGARSGLSGEWSNNSQLKCFSSVPSADRCMRMLIVMGKDDTGCQHSAPCVVIGPTQFSTVSQYTCVIIAVHSYTNSAISAPFLSQDTVATSFLAGRRLFTPFGLLGRCVRFNCFDCSLVSTFTNGTQVTFITIFVLWLKKSEPKTFSAVVPIREHFRNPSCTVIDGLA